MKVLMLMPDPAVKGSMARLGAQLIDALSQLRVDVAACRWGRHADDESLLVSMTGRVADLVHIRRLLIRGEYDVLFVSTAHDRKALMRDVPLLVATRGLARRRVLQFHGSLSNELSLPGRRVMKAASRWLVRNSDAVLVSSSEEAREWKAFEPRGTFHVVANAYVHNRELERSREEQMVLPRSQPPRILFVGRLIAAKGVFDLIEAVSLMQSMGTSCHLAFVGDGESRDALEGIIRSKNLQDTVELLGYVSELDLARAYRTAHVFVLPSYSEGFPTVLTEAMDAGLPIVTTGIRGAVDHLANGQNALFVPPGRVDLLADALQEVLADEDLRRKMAAANRARVRDFAPGVVAANYLRLLDAVLREPGRRHK